MRSSIENALAATRWLLLPFFIADILAIAFLLFRVVRMCVEFALAVSTITEDHAILEALAIVDLTLTSMLLLIVAMVGYELFISTIENKGPSGWPDWITHVDFADLKRKLMAAIVAISAIKLLEVFMDVESQSDRELGWTAGVHVVFVLSALALAIGDRVSAGAPKKDDAH